MTQSGGVPQIDRALATVVGAINALTERQDDGPGVVLTLGGVVVSGTVVPDWQWFEEVEHAARAAFVVHTGGSVDDEHGGWASLFKGVAESLCRPVTSIERPGRQRNISPSDTSASLPNRTAPPTSTSAVPAWSLPV